MLQFTADSSLKNESIENNNKAHQELTVAFGLNRSITPNKSKRFLKIDESSSLEKTVFFTDRKKCLQGHSFRYIPFECDNEIFSCITGNDKDFKLSKKLMAGNMDYELVFHIKNEKVLQIITPSKTWQDRFLKIIDKGMKVIYEMPDSAILSYSSKTVHNNPVPDCHAFVKMMNFSIYSEKTIITSKIMNNFQSGNNDEKYVAVGLIAKNEDDESKDFIVHSMIYFGNGVFMSKLGTDPIYFHTLEEILSLYENCCDQKLSINIIQYNLEDQASTQ
ncbi:hypothetical protein [Endozoicomonas ascidiicola]|uniref:hypothetical protein n=1 Tax=Endozoicomonas ascidiicola TaxID=1698521 RepID=UPI000831F138|nr:hypothetical protein [Endozoicomonas ascidiicola]